MREPASSGKYGYIFLALDKLKEKIPSESNSSARPRRGQEGRTSFRGANRKFPSWHSSEARTCLTTPSFSIACILHVEYTIFLTLGTERRKAE